MSLAPLTTPRQFSKEKYKQMFATSPSMPCGPDARPLTPSGIGRKPATAQQARRRRTEDAQAVPGNRNRGSASMNFNPGASATREAVDVAVQAVSRVEALLSPRFRHSALVEAPRPPPSLSGSSGRGCSRDMYRQHMLTSHVPLVDSARVEWSPRGDGPGCMLRRQTSPRGSNKERPSDLSPRSSTCAQTSRQSSRPSTPGRRPSASCRDMYRHDVLSGHAISELLIDHTLDDRLRSRLLSSGLRSPTAPTPPPGEVAPADLTRPADASSASSFAAPSLTSASRSAGGCGGRSGAPADCLRGYKDHVRAHRLDSAGLWRELPNYDATGGMTSTGPQTTHRLPQDAVFRSGGDSESRKKEASESGPPSIGQFEAPSWLHSHDAAGRPTVFNRRIQDLSIRQRDARSADRAAYISAMLVQNPIPVQEERAAAQREALFSDPLGEEVESLPRSAPGETPRPKAQRPNAPWPLQPAAWATDCSAGEAPTPPTAPSTPADSTTPPVRTVAPYAPDAPQASYELPMCTAWFPAHQVPSRRRDANCPVRFAPGSRSAIRKSFAESTLHQVAAGPRSLSPRGRYSGQGPASGSARIVARLAETATASSAAKSAATRR